MRWPDGAMEAVENGPAGPTILEIGVWATPFRALALAAAIGGAGRDLRFARHAV